MPSSSQSRPLILVLCRLSLVQEKDSHRAKDRREYVHNSQGKLRMTRMWEKWWTSWNRQVRSSQAIQHSQKLSREHFNGKAWMLWQDSRKDLTKSELPASNILLSVTRFSMLTMVQQRRRFSWTMGRWKIWMPLCATKVFSAHWFFPMRITCARSWET